MRRILLLPALPLLGINLMACTPSGAPTKELEERIQKQEQEIRDLKAKITEAEKINNELKQALSKAPPAPDFNHVAAGTGEGRFTVVPSRVQRGFPIAIFTEIGEGQIAIQTKDGKRLTWPLGRTTLLSSVTVGQVARRSSRLNRTSHNRETGRHRPVSLRQ
jgi:cell division septum initiation protein DivIVA